MTQLLGNLPVVKTLRTAKEYGDLIARITEQTEIFEREAGEDFNFD